MRNVFALVDANNFYATCESAFDPALKGRPVVVLSNNDGCVVARSAEAKALKIPMGAPIHQWRDFCTEHNVAIKSSNYTLYGDMSARMLTVLQEMCPIVESYSIDESFLDLTGLTDLTTLGYSLRQALRRRALITCGIGIGPTKTLAKFANVIAKKHHEYGGVFNMGDHSEAFNEDLMSKYPVNETWGVGPRLSAKLQTCGIDTVLDLKRCDHKAIHKNFSVTLSKTVRELQGISCIDMDDVDRPKEQIMVSRSFGKVLTDFQDLRAAIIHHTTRAGEKLRAQGSEAQHVYVMVRTNPFRVDDLQYRKTELIPLSHPTADTRVLIHAALKGLRSAFLPGFKYHKCGIMLGQVNPAGERQEDLFAPPPDPKQLRLMSLLDGINRKHGRNTLHFAGADISKNWVMRAGNRSPLYTTRWSDIPLAQC